MVLATLSIQSSNTQIKREFTVTQIALDAEYERLRQEDTNTSDSEKNQYKGGVTEDN